MKFGSEITLDKIYVVKKKLLKSTSGDRSIDIELAALQGKKVKRDSAGRRGIAYRYFDARYSRWTVPPEWSTTPSRCMELMPEYAYIEITHSDTGGWTVFARASDDEPYESDIKKRKYWAVRVEHVDLPLALVTAMLEASIIIASRAGTVS